MSSDSELCIEALGTHVFESIKDFGQRIYEEPGVEGVNIYPVSKPNGFAEISLSFFRKGDADDSSIVFSCTHTGSMVVSMFIAGDPCNSPPAPAIVTRAWVDDTVAKFVRDVFARPGAS
jgi:hypothetical protein